MPIVMLEIFLDLRICDYVEDCLEKLTQVLLLRYGRLQGYSYPQIEAAMRFAEMGDEHRPYAYALFMTRDTFEASRHRLPSDARYHILICDIQETLMPDRNWRILMRRLHDTRRSVATGFAGPPPRSQSMAWVILRKRDAERALRAAENRQLNTHLTPRIVTS